MLVRSLTTRDEDLKVEFRRQVEVFHRVMHPNLAAIVGYCREVETPQLVLIDYHQLGNLKVHLQTQPLSKVQTQSAVLQLARGMHALAEARFVHRDLGTRNMLVNFHDQEVCQSTNIYPY